MGVVKQVSKTKATCKVTFKLPKGVAQQGVKLLGDFNAWDANASEAEMKQLKTGEFKAELNLAIGQSYAFRYLVDGTEWQNEPEADTQIVNEYGSENSVLVL